MKKALIVDDEEDICVLLKYQLKKMGIESSVVHTIAQGLKMFDPDDHELIFLDINLPDGNGLEAIPILKRKNKSIKIVVISAYDTNSERKKADELGSYDFLGKPFSKDDIIQLIKRIESEN